MELKELTQNFINIFGQLEEFGLEKITNSNCEKFLNLISGDLETDYLQKIWQFYMADREDKKQDFTPESLCQLVSELTKSKDEEWVYDMCSGSGALTIQKWVSNKNLKFVCEELDEKIIPFLIFNLKIRNIEGYVINGNVLTGEHKAVYKLVKGEKFSNIEPCMFFEYPGFDTGISNHPFNLKGEYKKEVELKNMNYVFVLKMLEKVNGKVAFILPNSVTCSEDEKSARKYLLENKKIRAVIAMPGKMFEKTQIPTTMLYFENADTISFIDCRIQNFIVEKREQKGELHTKNRVYIKELNTFSKENIEEILTAIFEKKKIIGFSKTVTAKEIVDDEWKTGIHVGCIEEEKKTRSYEDILNDLRRVMEQKNQNKLTINEVWAKELGFVEVFENANKGDEETEGLNDTIKNTLKLDINLPKQDYIRLTKSKELKWENKDKKELSSTITLALQTWKTMLHFLNKEENRYLVELRDKLLPDLMNGEIDVSGINIQRKIGDKM